MCGGGDRVEAMGEVGSCSRERRSPGPEASRRDRVPTGKAVSESRAVGGGGDPAPAEAEAVGSVTEVEFFPAVDGPVVGIMDDPERARGCTRGEG